MTDAGEDSAPAGLWLSISDVARVTGIHKSNVSRKVDELERDGLIEVRYGPNKTKLVNIGEYEFRVRETTDLAKEQAAVTAQANSEDPRYRDVQTRKIQIETAVKDYELQKLRGELVDVTRVNEVDRSSRRGNTQTDRSAPATRRRGACGCRRRRRDRRP